MAAALRVVSPLSIGWMEEPPPMVTFDEINPDDTTVSGIVDHHLRMSAAEALPELWLRMHPRDPAED